MWMAYLMAALTVVKLGMILVDWKVGQMVDTKVVSKAVQEVAWMAQLMVWYMADQRGTYWAVETGG